jgi:glycosyltransferase involved in cell wall biosynthesis
VHVVLSLLTLAPGQVGGSEAVLTGLLDEFRSGHGPEQLTAIASERVAEAYADRVDTVAARGYPSPRGSLARLVTMAAGMAAPPFGVPAGADVVHSPFTVPVPRTKLPTVVTLHDLQHRDMPSFFSRAERAWRSVAYDRAARRATLVITPSEFSKQRIVEVLGVAPDRIEAIPHGIDHARFRPGPVDGDAAVLARLNLPQPFLYYPANLWPHKNHARLIEAFGQLDSEMHLVLSGADYGRLSDLRLSDRVHHVGRLPFETLPAVYRRAGGVVYPSLYEGAGVPPLEAMACGCPVAASDIPPVRELCGDAAVLFDPEDVSAIAAAMGTLSSRFEALRQAGIEHAARFTWRASAERHVAAYEKAAARGALPSAPER